MTPAPPSDGEPPLPDLVHRTLPTGFRRRSVRIEPGVTFRSNGADWTRALIIVAEGAVEVASASGGSIVVAESDLFLLDSFGNVTLRAVGPAPTILVAIEREPSASHGALPDARRPTDSAASSPWSATT